MYYVCIESFLAIFCIADDGDSVSVYLLCLRQFRSVHPEVSSLSVETIGPCLHHISDQVLLAASYVYIILYCHM